MAQGGTKAVRRKRTTTRGVTPAAAFKLALALPGVEEGLSWGTPGLKVKGRFLARLKEDGESLVLRIGFLERDQLMKEAPDAFYVTDHYLNYPAVLIRLAKVRKNELGRLLREAWREVAPERLLSEAATRRPKATATKPRSKRPKH